MPGLHLAPGAAGPAGVCFHLIADNTEKGYNAPEVQDLDSPAFYEKARPGVAVFLQQAILCYSKAHW